jgi:uncharacterized protein YyaL (SSP411 family)
MNHYSRRFLVSTLLALTLMPAGMQSIAAKQTHLANQLKNHASPYLALHANDPVAWQDWSENAVKLARSQNKLLFLSIGYFSCHWCHVMQKESYQNSGIAAFLNKNFIPVKVDRELEPALDARLIAFVEQTRGIGGWPLNVFITPDGHPLFAVLYEPPEDFLKVLNRLNTLWIKDPGQLKKLARDHTSHGKGPGAPALDKARVSAYLDRLVIGMRGYADSLNGGFGEQSKFPSVPQLTFLMNHVATLKSGKQKARLLEILVLTLEQMANLGLRDHLGGGFFRYTVDPGWKTPHFEKMLYDNAQLASIYLQAGRLLDRSDFLTVAEDTLDFLLNSMADSQGAYIAALSALDSKGVEGGYYLWTTGELEKYLSPAEYRVYRLAWSVRDAAPFDQGYLPYAGMDVNQIAKETGKAPAEIIKILQTSKKKLLIQRSHRSLPRDTKILAGWNGLALKALAEAAQITKSEKYRTAASRLRNYIVSKLWDGHSLKRTVVSGREVGRVALEDYAYVAQGLYAWAQITGKAPDYQIVRDVLDQAWDRFYSRQGWRLTEKSLIKTEGGQDVIADGVTPSPSAIIAGLSLKIADRYKSKQLKNRALSALNSGHEIVNQDPFWYASHVQAAKEALLGK